MMRFTTFLVLSATAVVGTRPVAGQGFEPGTIAALPFTVAPGVRTPAAWGSALAISSAIKDVLIDGQRFTTVLDRTGDEAIIAELMRTEGVWNSGSAVQVAQDGQLNANYIAYGHITSQTFDPGNNCARIEFIVEISDVATGAAVLSERMDVNNDRTPGPITWCTEVTEATALSEAQNRVDDEFQEKLAEDFGKRFGYRLVDMREREGELQVLVRAADGDPRRGTDMVVMVTVTSAFGETYTEELGRLKVERVEGDVAIALFEKPEQAEAFVTHVNEHGPRSLQVKRR